MSHRDGGWVISLKRLRRLQIRTSTSPMTFGTPVYRHHHEASRTAEMTSKRTMTPVEQKPKALDEQAAIKEPLLADSRRSYPIRPNDWNRPKAVTQVGCRERPLRDRIADIS